MQDGSRQIKQAITLVTNSFRYEGCVMLSDIINKKFNFKCTVVKTSTVNQWKISIWKQFMPILVKVVRPYIIKEMRYKFTGYAI